VCDITPEHPSLSRIHAVVQLGKEGRIELIDLNSTHGTFINGKSIDSFVLLYYFDYV
jgi:pSer/pThr/pTyr-binding forkhead associated (FHA) protein